MQQLEELYRSGGMKRSDIENFLRVGNESLTATRMNLSRAADLVRSFKQVAVDQSDEDTRRFNVLDYLDEVLVSLRPRYKRTSHRVELSGDKDLVITSYPGVFMQIVTNILTNALLHAFDGMENGVLSIHAVRQGNDLTLTLADNGKGMTPEILSRVFEPFFSTRRGNGGTGLGMHIVYNLVTRRLKGTVQCRSTPGDGTTFTITVPMQDSPSAVQT
jgi:signal transduction histidine kinase